MISKAKKILVVSRAFSFFLYLSQCFLYTHFQTMEKLLQWAVDNSNKNSLSEQADAIRRGEAKPDPSKYDPKILEAILGKDDATRMKGI